MFLKWFLVCIVMARPTILGSLLLSHLIVFQPRRSTPLADESRLSVISFFNRVNSTLYVGKLMVIKSDNVWYAAYEIFLSVDPQNITDWDRNNVLAYTALALDTMEAMVDYITEIANGESADNVFAMWQADIGAV